MVVILWFGGWVKNIKSIALKFVVCSGILYPDESYTQQVKDTQQMASSGSLFEQPGIVQPISALPMFYLFAYCQTSWEEADAGLPRRPWPPL